MEKQLYKYEYMIRRVEMTLPPSASCAAVRLAQPKGRQRPPAHMHFLPEACHVPQEDAVAWLEHGPGGGLGGPPPWWWWRPVAV